MWRLLFGAGLLLAGLLYFLLSGAKETDPQSAGGKADPAPAQDRGSTATESSTLRPPTALRMRGQGGSEAEEPASAADRPTPAVAVQRIEESLAEAFAADSASPGNERNAMVRRVISQLVQKKIGNARVSHLECRTRHCLVQLAGEDQGELVQLVDALQDDRGFLGKAESMMLSRKDQDIAIYLRFPEEKAADLDSAGGLDP